MGMLARQETEGRPVQHIHVGSVDEDQMPHHGNMATAGSQHEASVAHRAVCTCAWAASFKQQPAQHTLEEHALGHAVGIAAFIGMGQPAEDITLHLLIVNDLRALQKLKQTRAAHIKKGPREGGGGDVIYQKLDVLKLRTCERVLTSSAS
ncbi:MAG: hypothetical protein FRX49_05811 [Trebouxia sp. A1-2]|nr:MAG: hypothetical protein FRX49_05811 [Trebouxia sp. A1-2]